MILLYHETTTNSTITTAARLGREHHSPRTYQSVGHFLPLNGPAHIISQDAEEICKIPGYRLATPQEQNAYRASKRKTTQVAEDAPADEDSDESDDTPTGKRASARAKG